MLVKHFLLSCELLYVILMGVCWTVAGAPCREDWVAFSEAQTQSEEWCAWEESNLQRRA